jgi:hypothetical protein
MVGRLAGEKYIVSGIVFGLIFFAGFPSDDLLFELFPEPFFGHQFLDLGVLVEL